MPARRGAYQSKGLRSATGNVSSITKIAISSAQICIASAIPAVTSIVSNMSASAEPHIFVKLHSAELKAKKAARYR